MHLTCLSRDQNRPSFLLQWPSLTVLLDCSADLTPFSYFLPIVLVESTRLSSLPGFSSTDKVKICGDLVFVDGLPEVHPPELSDLDLASVDVILVSNWISLLGLPFLTERPEFRAVVYATDPTLQFGRIVMEELLEYVKRANNDVSCAHWRSDSIYNSFPNRPKSDPKFWRPLYSTDQMNRSLAIVKPIAYRETVDMHGLLLVSAFSSGHSMGSTNWTLRTEHEKVAYSGASSSRTSHTKAVDWTGLIDADFLLLTCICTTMDPSHGPEESVRFLCSSVLSTVHSGGVCLLPVSPSGMLFDLIECLVAVLDSNIPIYLLSPVVDNALAFANIYTEWLSEKKQDKVYIPEEPFAHSALLKSGRLRPYPNMHGNFSRDFRMPCVIFTGHPSLRFGDVVHFIELWRSDPNHSLILTDPDYPMREALGPFQPISMRTFYYPIDTRLDFSQINSSIIRDLRPKILLLPKELAEPPKNAPDRTDLAVLHENRLVFEHGECLQISSDYSSHKRIRLDPDIVKHMELISGGVSFPDTGIASIRGYLSAYDNVFELMSESSCKENGNEGIRPRLTGCLDTGTFAEMLRKKGVRVELVKDDSDSAIFRVPEFSAIVTIVDGGSKSRINCESMSNRSHVADLIAGCLTPI